MAHWQAIVSELPALRRYARALARDVERADDLVQLTVERAARKWTLYSPSRNLRPWLFQILHNQYVDEFRREQRQPAAIDPGLIDANAQQNLPASSLHIDLESAMRKLNQDYLEIFLLACLEEFSYKEIGNILRIPVGTVMSRLSRARAQLRNILQSYQSSDSNVRVLDQTFRQKMTDIDKEGAT